MTVFQDVLARTGMIENKLFLISGRYSNMDYLSVKPVKSCLSYSMFWARNKFSCNFAQIIQAIPSFHCITPSLSCLFYFYVQIFLSTVNIIFLYMNNEMKTCWKFFVLWMKNQFIPKGFNNLSNPMTTIIKVCWNETKSNWTKWI